MPSPRKISANRANARRSTGPRTAGGRLRASLNALKHGLAVPAAAHPAFQQDIDHLARVLAGEAQHDPVVMVRALKVAEAAIDVQRARRARLELLRGWDLSTGKPNRVAPVESIPDVRPLRKSLRNLALQENSKERMRQIKVLQRVAKTLERVGKLVIALEKKDPAAPYRTSDHLFRQLERLERYERRARSRRERAIKEFDYMKAKAMSI
jgi:hypothetical protein